MTEELLKNAVGALERLAAAAERMEILEKESAARMSEMAAAQKVMVANTSALEARSRQRAAIQGKTKQWWALW